MTFFFAFTRFIGVGTKPGLNKCHQQCGFQIGLDGPSRIAVLLCTRPNNTSNQGDQWIISFLLQAHLDVHTYASCVLLCTTGSCIHKTGKTEQLRNSSGGYVCSCYAYMRQARPLFLSSTGLYLISYTRFSY